MVWGGYLGGVVSRVGWLDRWVVSSGWGLPG